MKFRLQFSKKTLIQISLNECFQYFDSLLIESGAPEFAFEHKRGDILLWHGHTLHRGANPQKDESRRHSMTVHFTVR